jgi:PhnB protein
MTNTNPVHRYPTITPHLGVEDPAAALDFYKRAFDAQELVRLALPDGTIAHAEMLVGDALVTLGKAIPEYHLVAPSPDDPVQVSITYFTDDADAVYTQAVEAGASAVTPVADQSTATGSARCGIPSGTAGSSPRTSRTCPTTSSSAAWQR